MMETDIGIVLIGRNEGERFKNSLRSVKQQLNRIVYVDSGSIDGSVSHAKTEGIDVVELDMSSPFSAARARNEGCHILMKKYDDIKYIQFIDGDCDLADGWIKTAYDFLVNNTSYAIIAGQRKEKYPDRTLYNKLCDIEWTTEAGDIDSCGGDFMVRGDAFRDVSGFNPSVIAGEEPELCYRLRKNGWKIFCVDDEMTYHDADMTRFSQWWIRAKRAGHAYAHGFALHFSDHRGFNRRMTVKVWAWCFFLPAVILLSGWLISPLLYLLLVIYPLRFTRILVRSYRRFEEINQSFLYTLFVYLADIPHLLGQIVFWTRLLSKKDFEIIEHKQAVDAKSQTK